MLLFVGDDIDDTDGRVATEQGALWPLGDLDPVDIYQGYALAARGR